MELGMRIGLPQPQDRLPKVAKKDGIRKDGIDVCYPSECVSFRVGCDRKDCPNGFLLKPPVALAFSARRHACPTLLENEPPAIGSAYPRIRRCRSRREDPWIANATHRFDLAQPEMD